MKNARNFFFSLQNEHKSVCSFISDIIYGNFVVVFAKKHEQLTKNSETKEEFKNCLCWMDSKAKSHENSFWNNILSSNQMFFLSQIFHSIASRHIEHYNASLVDEIIQQLD